MEHQEGEIDMESLFEGMDLVVSDSPLQDIKSGDSKKDTQIEENTPSILHSTQGAVPQPLDEGLFCGLSFSSIDNEPVNNPASEGMILITDSSSAFEETTRNTRLLDNSFTSGLDVNVERDRKNLDILAAYDDLSPKSSSSNSSSLNAFTRPTFPLPKLGVRKKKKGLRIGYARDAEEYEENGHMKQSSHGPELEDANKDSWTLAGSKPDLTINADFRTIAVVHSELSNPNEVVEMPDIVTQVEANYEHESGSDKNCTIQSEGHDDMKADISVTTDEAAVQNPDSSAETGDVVKIEYGDKRVLNVKLDADEVELKCDDSAGQARQNIDERLSEAMNRRLQIAKAELDIKLKNLQTKAAEASVLRKSSAQLRRQAAEKVSNASAQRKELESELQAACERDDFETAIKLSDQILEAEKVIEQAEASLKDAEISCDSAFSTLQEILMEQIAVEEEGEHMFAVLQQEAETAAERITKQAEELNNEKIEFLSVEEAALELKRTKLMGELTKIEEANSEIDRDIEASTSIDLQEQTRLVEEKTLLENELQDLLALVKLKEAQIIKHDTLIANIEERINTAKAGFAHKKVDFALQSKALSIELGDLEIETQHIQREREKLKAGLSCAEEESVILKRSASSALQEVCIFQEVLERRRRIVQTAKDMRDKKIKLTEKENQALKESQDIKQEMTAARTIMEELSSSKAKLHQEITRAKQRLVFIDKRGPELETEKKHAATTRNFKEAARLAAEAKSLSAEKDNLNKEIESYTLEFNNLEIEIESKRTFITELERLIIVKDKVAAKSRCERLRLVAAAARDERHLAIDLKDFEEAENLEAEAIAADLEADSLQVLHELHEQQYGKVGSDEVVSQTGEESSIEDSGKAM